MELVIASVLSGVLTLVFIPQFIKFFHQKKLGQTTREEGPLWHEVKTGTPTMGGTVFILASLVTILIAYFIFNLSMGYSLAIWLSLLLFGGIGFVDDFISVFQKKNEGLTARQKFLTQLIFSVLIVFVCLITNIELVIPFFGYNIENMFLIGLFAFIWITGFSNAVNLTDGLDGLATGLNIIAYGAYAILAHVQGNYTIQMICLIVVGSLVGFLFFNIKPAKIFMGDVGSLALGAGLAVISLLLNNPWSLLIIGIVFVIETASVIIQVTSFKLTGKRVFKMSPIHHHFEMSGWSEQRVVYTFWGIGFVAALLYLLFIVF